MVLALGDVELDGKVYDHLVISLIGHSPESLIGIRAHLNIVEFVKLIYFDALRSVIEDFRDSNQDISIRGNLSKLHIRFVHYGEETDLFKATVEDSMRVLRTDTGHKNGGRIKPVNIFTDLESAIADALGEVLVLSGGHPHGIPGIDGTSPVERTLGETSTLALTSTTFTNVTSRDGISPDAIPFTASGVSGWCV